MHCNSLISVFNKYSLSKRSLSLSKIKNRKTFSLQTADPALNSKSLIDQFPKCLHSIILRAVRISTLDMAPKITKGEGARKNQDLSLLIIKSAYFSDLYLLLISLTGLSQLQNNQLYNKPIKLHLRQNLCY